MFEYALITKILDSESYNDAKHVITSDHFFDVQARSAWNFLTNYHREHNATPSREIFESRFSNFDFESLPDPVSALVERVHDHFIYNHAQVFIEKIAEIAASDTIEAAKYISEQGTRFRALVNAGQGNTGIDITTRLQDERAEYLRRKNCHGVLGYTWPWERLNQATFGIMPGQLIVYYARPKMGKTWTLLYTLQHLFYQHKLKVVMFTREMTVEELQRRFVSIYTGIDYQRYLQGSLTTAEERRWDEGLEALEESQSFIIDTVKGSGEDAADMMIEKAIAYGADAIGVDGLYFFGDREWEVIAKFTSRLKWHLLHTHKIPCLATSQASKLFSVSKKGKNSLDDVGYGGAITEDADMLIKQILIEDEGRAYLSVPGAREAKSCELQIWFKPGGDFTQAFAEDPVDETTAYNDDGEIKDPTA